MKREPTAEQKTKAAERKARFRTLVKQVAAMNDQERAQLTNRVGAVLTCQGHALSLTNTMLLILQCPGVSMVGGFRQWLKQSRCVKKGEHGSMIWIPIGSKAKEGADGQSEPTTDEVDRAHFIIGTVFDIGQTTEIQKEVAA